MQKKLNLKTNVVYIDAIKEIMESIHLNGQDKISSISINKFSVHELKKFSKPTLYVRFKRLKRFSKKETKINCFLKVVFLGKGDIPYEVHASCSISSILGCNHEKLLWLKTYTYVYLKHMLENDIKLLELYPRDLIYPESDKITGFTLGGVREESIINSSGCISQKIDLDDSSDDMLINIFKDESTKKKELTKEDDEEYKRLIEKYNKIQKQA